MGFNGIWWDLMGYNEIWWYDTAGWWFSWNMTAYFSIWLGDVIIPIDELIHLIQRGRSTTNQSVCDGHIFLGQMVYREMRCEPLMLTDVLEVPAGFQMLLLPEEPKGCGKWGMTPKSQSVKWRWSVFTHLTSDYFNVPTRNHLGSL